MAVLPDRELGPAPPGAIGEPAPGAQPRYAYRLHPVCGWEIGRDAGAPEPALPPPAVARRDRASGPPPKPTTARRRSRPSASIRVLLLGCLPGVRAEPAAIERATLETYVEHYLARRRYGGRRCIRELGPFISFLRLAAVESGTVR